MIYVLDASAGIEIALKKEKAEVFEKELLKASKIITSDLYKGEIANVLWKYHRADLLSKEEALETQRYCEHIVDEFVDLLSNSEESLVESMRSGHPAYDFFYLTLARRRGGILVTMDKKMNMLAVQNGIEIVA